MSDSAIPTREHPATSRFGRFELQSRERRLLEDGQPVALGARAFDLLAVLVDRAGQLVAKNVLLTLVWPGLVVEENNLQVQVSALRKVLGQSALATIPGRGYRFELPVERDDAIAPTIAPSLLAPAAAPGPPRARTNLPAHLLALYGRAHDVRTIKALLRQHEVVTVVGAGGIGKTRVAQAVAAEIAVEAAAEFPDGVWWIELAALSDGALVPSAVAQVLGVPLSGDRSPNETLAALLASQRLLLVLDNCEHLTDFVAELIESVRAATPRVRFLATSQETLKTAEEHVYRVGALLVPAHECAADALHAGAIELFVARAEEAVPSFALTPAHAPAVIEICRRLDGIPLAIELAAARLPLLGVEGMRARLDERFNVLTAGARVVLRRHQTLRATLEWSHGLLTADEQTVFRRLAVFAGSFTLEAAQQVAGDERIDAWAALDNLGALVDKSLVLAEGDPVPRYRLLETTRAYALERLAQAGETERMLRRHAEAVLALVSAFEADDRRWRITPADAIAAAAELDNLRAALAWVVAVAAGSDLVVPLAGASYPIWAMTSHLAEGLDRLLALRPRLNEGVPLRDVAQFWLTLTRLGQYAMRRESYEAGLRAAEFFRQLGDDSRRHDALLCAAVQGIRCASIPEMERAIAEAAPLERADWPARQRAALQFARCWWYARLARYEEALACAELQVAINREGGNLLGEQYSIANVAAMEVLLGRAESARRRALAAIDRVDELGGGASSGHLYWNMMLALIQLGRLDEAASAGRAAHSRLQHEGDEAQLFAPFALLLALQGRLADAARIIGHDDAVHAKWNEDGRPHSVPLRARLDPLLTAAFAAPELARLQTEGAAMRDEQVFRLGFGDEA
jgi:predicted ATPase/DNA-binding winged helix-turn-helix (wHTH) protein